MDDNQVWAIISPRSAIHVARLEHESIFPDKEDGPTVGWVYFPCLGSPHRAASDLICCTDSDDDMKELAAAFGSRGMFCMKGYCENERKRFTRELMAAELDSDVPLSLEEEMETTVNNTTYEDGSWGGIEAWQVMVTICVVVAIIAIGGLIWHGIDMSRADNTAHQKTLQVKYQTCAHDDNPRFCLQKVQE